KGLLKKNHVDVRELSAKKHDHLMSYVQALSHFSDLVLADVLNKSGLSVSNFLKYQSPPYRLKLDMMGRILNQDPNLYAQIQIQNPESLKVMKTFLKSAEQWTDLVEQKDMKSFEKKFQKASQYLSRYKRLAMEESDWLIEQLNRKKFLEEGVLKPMKPDKTYQLVVLGPENTFSSLAAKKYDSKAKIWYANTITEVFGWVQKGVIQKGIVPIENKMTGSVVETSDNLFESKLKIQESFELPIHHFLATLNKVQKSEIKTIYSHAQPIRQCRKYLKKHFPKVDFVSMPSTAAALKKVVSENLYDSAVICSEDAAKAFRMTLLAKNIEDYKLNSTRFVVIGKKEAPIKKSHRYKTSIAFYFSADAPGTLYQVLGEFAGANANMTKIESSANPQIPGGHVFYVDFEGHSTELYIKKMLSKIKKHVAVLKVLGSY
ncbi:prephenate dehydratase, partial [Candidatus Pacearchaeota archaeon]|nr:prephenate dehydratase [Candidatus Pacearchaeota archaeon]